MQLILLTLLQPLPLPSGNYVNYSINIVLFGKVRNETHFSEDTCLTLQDIRRGTLARELAWIWKSGGYQSALSLRQMERIGVEMFLCYGIGTVDAITHLDRVQIDFHDTLLRPHELNQRGEIDLEALPDP